MGCEHLVQNGERDARLVAEFRNVAVAWVQIRLCARFGRQRIVAAVVFADAVAELAV